MVRLVMILPGIDYLRTRRRSLQLIGWASLLLGVVVFIDALDGAFYFPITPFAWLLPLEGLATLAVAWKSRWRFSSVSDALCGHRAVLSWPRPDVRRLEYDFAEYARAAPCVESRGCFGCVPDGLPNFDVTVKTADVSSACRFCRIVMHRFMDRFC